MTQSNLRRIADDLWSGGTANLLPPFHSLKQLLPNVRRNSRLPLKRWMTCAGNWKGYIGLAAVKREVESLINLVSVQKLRKENGLPVSELSLHMVFSGNPGTGKTMIARLMARVYRCLGILSKGQLVEVDRGGLVARLCRANGH